MRITKYGRVTVTEDNVVVDQFHFDGSDGGTVIPDGGRLACEWAIKRIQEDIASAESKEEVGKNGDTSVWGNSSAWREYDGD